MFRALGYAATVLTILIVMSWWDGTGWDVPDIQALGQSTFTPPTETPTAESSLTPELPTPTDTPTEVASSTAEVPTDTATAVSTATETPTPDPGTPTGTPDPSQTPETTPTVDPSLPPLTETTDPPGAVATATIGSAGGRIATTDGRVVIDFPAGATNEDLNVSITKADHSSLITAMGPDNSVVGLWDFEAVAPGRGNAPVEQFAAGIRVWTRFSPTQLGGLNPASLRYWTLDEGSGQWMELPSAVNAYEKLIVVDVDHFSSDAATASSITDLAPVLDGKLANPHTGSASLSIPIQVPPGQGGLQPELTLSYDSGRVAELREYMDMSGWVGHGWELGLGSIDVSKAPFEDGFTVFCGVPCYGTPDHYLRYFLNGGNFGGEMIPVGAEYVLRDQSYIRIKPASGGGFEVTTQSGTKYSFGTDANSRRYYCEDLSAGCDEFYYRYDLNTIEDTSGNLIDIHYSQQQGRIFDASGTYRFYILSSYPDEVTYNDGRARVVFTTGADISPQTTDWWPGFDRNIATRSDGPRKVQNQGGTVQPPLVLETRRLNSIDVQIKSGTTWSNIRTYDFDYTTTNFDADPDGRDDCPFGCSAGLHYPWRPRAGTMTLDSLSVTDRTGTSNLYTMGFDYDDLAWSFDGQGASYGTPSEYELPLLTRVDNGFGARVEFDYVLKEGDHWTRQVVEEERHIPCVTGSVCASQPTVRTTYDYGTSSDGPHYYPYTDLQAYAYDDDFHAAYRGFRTVAETDAGGNSVLHEFYTTDLTGTAGTDWNDEVRTGKEWRTTIKDSGGNPWRVEETDWSVREVGYQEQCVGLILGGCPGNYDAPNPNNWKINFVFPASKTITLNGTQLKTINVYDNGTSASDCRVTSPAPPICFGLLTTVDDLGEPTDQDARVLTVTDWNKNTTAWVFTPRSEVKQKPDTTELSRTQFYYDGLNTHTPSTAPAIGRLTATVTKLNTNDAQPTLQWSTVYKVYDAYGQVIQASVPTHERPWSYSAGSSFGWIPSGVRYSQTEYDLTHHVYPTKVTAAQATPALETVYSYTDAINGDFLWGKPTQITEPNGHWTKIRYDDFGRPFWAWDSLDAAGCSYISCSYPTVKFTYTWGSSLPNSTKVEQRVESGTAKTRDSITCMDGFGRALAASHHYDAGAANLVRTDYNDRGMQSVVTNPMSAGTGTVQCPASFSLIGTNVDRTTYAYDPLGNVSTSMQIPANATVGPRTTFVDNGSTTVSIDELYRRTVTERSVGDLTTIVTEPLPSVILRPTGLGQGTQWTINGTTSRVDAVDDTTPDESSTYLSSTTKEDLESQTYSGAGLPSGTTVSGVVFHFRWKQDVVPTNSQATGLKPYYRQGIRSVGPLYHRTTADGWVDEYWELPLNPVTGSAWTLAQVNGQMEFGFETGDSGSAPQVTQAWVEVVTQSPTSAQTVYTNDLLGRLVKVRDAQLNETILEYDLAGRKTFMTDPDMSGNIQGSPIKWEYKYDAAGNLTSQKDARNITTALVYDDNLRLTEKNYSDNTPDVFYKYDFYEDANFCTGAASPLGMLTRTTDGAGVDANGRSTLSCYDQRGRVTKTQRAVTGVPTPYITTFSNFDDLDRARTITYADGEVVTYTSTNNQGFFNSMSSDPAPAGGAEVLVEAIVRNAWGATESLALGTTNDLVTTFQYDHRLRVTDIQTGAGASNVQDLTYTFDDASNVKAVQDDVDGEELAYSYDQLDRLTGMAVDDQAVAWYRYDQIGNLLNKREGPYGSELTYPASGQGAVRPHGATRVRGYADLTLSYDNNGNLTSRGDGLAYTYDAENRLTNRPIHGGTMTYSYSGDGGLVKRTDSSKNTSTVYAGGMEQTFSGTTVTGTTKYYAFEGQTVAMRRDGVVSYLLRDHLGSASVVVNQSGAVVATTKYWPFGLTREQTGVMPTDKLFTGQQKEQDDVLELYNYGARFYSAALGRFVGVDPVVPSAGDQQAWNPYAYVRNNPLMYTDPTGTRWADDGGGNCDLECQQANDPYYQEAAAQDWVEAPAMEPYEPCVQCLILIAAAIAYEQAAQTAAWAAAAPVTNPSSYEQQASFYAQTQQQSDAGEQIQTGAFVAGTTLVAVETLDPAPFDPLAWLVGGGVALSGVGIGWLAAEATNPDLDFRPVVIGENQPRVIAYAEAHGLDYYHSWRSHAGFFMQQNAEWLENDVIKRNRTIVDIGPAPGYPFYPEISSPYYQMERDMIEDYKYPYYTQAPTYGR